MAKGDKYLMYVTSNVIHRTFQITFGKGQATCFAVDCENRQYIVTARHIVKTITDSAIIRIKHERVWKDCPVNLVGHCEGEIDISVLSAERRLAPDHPLPLTAAGLTLGQDVYFLGFPYGLTGEFEDMNRNFPVPFVKKAIVSALDSKTSPLYLDGHNNPGFSGGPVVFSQMAKPDNELSVAGVISGYRYNREPVYLFGMRTPLKYKYNTGIVAAYGIQHAVDLIHRNPIGFDLGS